MMRQNTDSPSGVRHEYECRAAHIETTAKVRYRKAGVPIRTSLPLMSIASSVQRYDGSFVAMSAHVPAAGLSFGTPYWTR
jgi:hypothetical protein